MIEKVRMTPFYKEEKMFNDDFFDDDDFDYDRTRYNDSIDDNLDDDQDDSFLVEDDWN